jgi:cytochrome c-type biogenesis protein CcmH/NrfG
MKPPNRSQHPYLKMGLKNSILTVHPHSFSHLLPLIILSSVAFAVLTDSLFAQPCTNQSPVTNECVEASLRQQREALRTLPEFQAGTPETHLRLAELLMQQGDPNGAIEEYQTAIQLNPAMEEAFRGMGAVYLDKHEWGLAEEALQSSSRLDQTNRKTFFWLGRALLAQAKFPEAAHALTTATKLDNQDAETFSDLALAHMAQGQFMEAGAALHQAIRLKPDLAEAHHRLEVVQSARQDSDRLKRSTQEILVIYFRRE